MNFGKYLLLLEGAAQEKKLLLVGKYFVTARENPEMVSVSLGIVRNSIVSSSCLQELGLHYIAEVICSPNGVYIIVEVVIMVLWKLILRKISTIFFLE